MKAMNERLALLAAQLQHQDVAAFLQPTHDQFLSEYPPGHARRLAWLSGFDGSAGTLLVPQLPINNKRAILFTDGRYTLQAAEQLDRSLFEVIDRGSQSPIEWWRAHGDDQPLGYDPWLHPHAQVRGWNEVKLQPLAVNPVDAIWTDRPPMPAEPAFAHPLRYAGESSQGKRARLLASMDDQAEAVLLTMPDGINWLLNMRGNDIPFNPLALCYALIARDGSVRLISEPRQWPETNQVSHVSLQDFQAKPHSFLKSYKTLQIDPNTAPEAIWSAASDAGCKLISRPDPTLRLKAIKNEAEINGSRAAHARDGRALTRFLQWLEKQEGWSELQAAQKLETLRFEENAELYCGPSFDTISGSGPNGAIVHYRVTESTNRTIQHGELYLVDSGGQYPDGTTDVTRTIVHGEPTWEMIDRYTRVLKGHIALATAIFPLGTSGSQLDALARRFLWDIGCDYAHGTGHGVGSYLCVHEGPQRISKRAGDVPLEPGMICSNEPGYYKAGEYGIRIENLVLVVEAEYEGYLAFETLTLAPLDERLINHAMLCADEQAWLEVYQRRVSDNMVP